MKKNFFKKLSFVLALAMIVTALAPAAGAFAAKAPKLNASSKYLYLGVDGKDEFDFNISNKVKGWKYLWTSANEDVASVNKKNGLTTAEAAGKTKISVVITDKDGEEVDELTATVTVRDNIKTLTITNLPTDGKVAVGVAHDFNRSYVTVANKTKGSEGVTRWSVSPSEGATISDMGVFTATKAGEYTITARAFQSKAKYTSWLADATKYASYVTSNEATYKVTVAASMVSAKQVNLKKFDLTFDTAMTKADIEKNLVVYYVLGGTKVKEAVKSVSMSADSKVATIEMNYDFTKGTTYVVEYPNMKSVEFVSATTKLEDVVDMAIKTKTAQLSKETKLDIALLNKDGVNIANDELLGRVTTEKSDNNYAYLDGARVLYMHKLGEVVKLTSTFHTYNYKDGKEVGNVTATGEVTCVEVSKDVAGSLYAWTIKDFGVGNEPTNFTTTKNTTFKGSNQQLYVLLKGKNSSDEDMYTANFAYAGSPSATQGPLAWKYTSSNESVLLVDGSGRIYGVKEGAATVVVSYNDVQVAACEITVAGARKAAMASLSTNTLTLSNAFSDPTTLTFEVKDQFGDDYKVSGAWNATAEVTYNGSEATNPYTGAGLTFNANGFAAKTYNYTVKIKDNNDSNVSIPLNLSISVQDPGANTTVASYRIEADKASYDMKTGSTISTAAVNLAVYAYNSAGIKVAKLTTAQLEALGSVITVRKPGSTTGSGIIVSDQIDLVTTKTVSGRSVVSNEKTGSWVITATNTNTANGDKVVNAAGFEVKNTQAKAIHSVKNTVTDKVSTLNATTLATVINECLTFTVGDKTIRAEAGFLGSDYFISDKRVTLGKIKLYEQVGATSDYIEHEVDLSNMVLYIK
jgi:hypothetical protein